MCESDTDKRNPTCPHCTALVQFDKARIFSIFQSWKIWPKSKRGICLVSKNFTHFCLWDICLGSFWHFLPISWKYFFWNHIKEIFPVHENSRNWNLFSHVWILCQTNQVFWRWKRFLHLCHMFLYKDPLFSGVFPFLDYRDIC